MLQPCGEYVGIGTLTKSNITGNIIPANFSDTEIFWNIDSRN